MKDAEEWAFTWEQVSVEKPLKWLQTAPSGTNWTFHTLEQRTQRRSSLLRDYAWTGSGGLHLYKVGKSELPQQDTGCASFGNHVGYMEAETATGEDSRPESYDKIYKSGEKYKNAVLYSKRTHLYPWEDFQVYCATTDKNDFRYGKEDGCRELL